MENEYQFIESDRIGLLAQAIEFVGLFQRKDAAIQSEPTGDELKTYQSALKLIEKEFRKGPSLAENVVVKSSTETACE